MMSDSFITNTATFNTPNSWKVESVVVDSTKIPCVLGTLGYLPSYQTQGAAGADLCCSEAVTVESGSMLKVALGVSIALPPGTVGLVYIRSSWAQEGLCLANGVGVIDSDYRGDISLLLCNCGPQDISLASGTRVAQLVVTPYLRLGFEAVDSLDSTQRGTGGFGSTSQAGAD